MLFIVGYISGKINTFAKKFKKRMFFSLFLYLAESGGDDRLMMWENYDFLCGLHESGNLIVNRV